MDLKKSKLFIKIVTTKKEDIPYSFAPVSVQNIREMDQKESTRKKFVYVPPIIQNCVDE